MTSKKYKIFFLILLLLSIGLRIGLVSVNREANDPHDEVITYIIEHGTLPEKDDCWECFQPKLFHYTAAKMLQLPLIENAKEEIPLPLAVDLINFMAGIITVFVIGLFITNLPVKNETLKLLAFGLISLNPKLIGVNSQVTNDSFAILFSTLALYFMVLFLHKQKTGTFLLVLLFTLLGISTKTNVWVIAIAIFMVMLVKAWTQKKDFVAPVLLGTEIPRLIYFPTISPFLRMIVLNSCN
ncbi:MAG: glycosyltransferase family 39 protein, partial [Anaerolineaceae bacterium]|nr:glycosyltransferase family 39 protein [Anaerolineaceae bacterium]